MSSTVMRQNSALNNLPLISLQTGIQFPTPLTPHVTWPHFQKHFKRLGIPPEFPHEWFHTSTSRNSPRSGQTGQKSHTVPYPGMSSIQHPYAQRSLWLTAAESPFIYIISKYGIENHRLVQFSFTRMCYHFKHRTLSCRVLPLQQPLRRVSVFIHSFIQSFKTRVMRALVQISSAHRCLTRERIVLNSFRVFVIRTLGHIIYIT